MAEVWTMDFTTSKGTKRITLELAIDKPMLARLMGRKANRNSSRRATALSSAVTVMIMKEEDIQNG